MLDFNRETMETLELFVEQRCSNDDKCSKLDGKYLYKIKNSNEELLLYGDMLKKYGTLNTVSNPEYYTCLEIKCNIQKIIEDVCKKCLIKNPTFYELKYFEYVVRETSKNYKQNQYQIFNSIDKTFTPIGDLQITEQHAAFSGRPLHIMETINTSIVDDILNNLITNKDKIKEYKNFMYNILVKPSNTTNIFYDNKEGHLTSWTSDVFDILGKSKTCLECSDYCNDVKYYNKLIKNNVIRFAIIRYNATDKQINYFTKLGIQNIIIANSYDEKTFYNTEKNFIKYLNDNKDLILPHTNVDNSPFRRDITSVNEIFYRTSLLMTNFIMWCCD
jgi:hypothetical protein